MMLHKAEIFLKSSGLAALAVLLVTVLGCSPSSQPAASPAASATQPASQPAAPAKVRVGYLASDLHHVSHFVAKDPTVGGGKSLYQKYGLDVEDAVGAPYENGGVEMDRFASGDIDMGMLGLPPALIKYLNSGTDTFIAAQLNEIGSSLVVGKGINKFSDLAGKTVATPGHSSIQFFLLLTLAQKEGVDPSRITIIDMPVKDMQARLDNGSIAAFIAWEPFPSASTLAGVGRVMATSQDIWPNHPDCVVVVNNQFAAKNPEVAQRMLKANMEATQWISDALAKPDSKEYNLLVDIGTKFTGRPADVVKAAYKGIRYRATVDDAFRNSVVQFTDKLIQFKIVPAEKLQERGYKSSADFAAAYIKPLIQETTK